MHPGERLSGQQLSNIAQQQQQQQQRQLLSSGSLRFSFGLHSSTVKHTACHTPASGNSSDCNDRCLNNHRAGCSSNTIAKMWLSVLQQDSRWQLLSLQRDIDCNVRSGQLLRCLGQSYASLLSMLGRCTCIIHVMNCQ